uniref:Reverse transcriptase zinc-binding domain-containing protein n=1 Tax=Cannabis sativa TaxID=3483 RepID=A0A803QQX8_CANSA
MKNLVWRASNGCLPTMAQLRSKHVEVNSLCQVCSLDDESILHALVTYLVIKLCWDRVDWEEKELLVAISWAIWNARNDRVWQNKIVGMDIIILLVRGFLNQWLNAQNDGLELSFTSFLPSDGAEHWMAPQEKSVKVNVDAAMFGETRQFGIGFVARDA